MSGGAKVAFLLQAMQQRIQRPRTDSVPMPRKLLDHSQAEDRFFDRVVLAAAGEGAILAGQAEPHRECSMAVSGDSVAW